MDNDEVRKREKGDKGTYIGNDGWVQRRTLRELGSIGRSESKFIRTSRETCLERHAKVGYSRCQSRFEWRLG